MAAKVQLWVATPTGETALNETGDPVDLPLRRCDIETLAEGFDITAAGEGVINIEVEGLYPGDDLDLYHGFSIELKRTVRGTWWDAQRDF